MTMTEITLKAGNKKDFTLLAKSNLLILKTNQMAADVDNINKDCWNFQKNINPSE